MPAAPTTLKFSRLSRPLALAAGLAVCACGARPRPSAQVVATPAEAPAQVVATPAAQVVATPAQAPAQVVATPVEAPAQVVATLAEATPTRYPADAALSPLTPSVVARVREIAARAPGLDDHRFMKAGSSGTVNPHFLGCFAARPGPFFTLDLGEHGTLARTLDWFRPTQRGVPDPFTRWSRAAEVGRTADWALRGKPSPLRTEFDALRPRFAVVEFGTNDMVMAMTHRSALFPFVERLGAVLDTLTEAGVVPVVTGVGPRAHAPTASLWVPTYDAVMRALAEARQVPYLSLAVAHRGLPGQGLARDGMHADALNRGTVATPCVFTDEGLRHGYNVRNLLTLTALDALRAALFEPTSVPPEPPTAARPPLQGRGTPEAPFEIDALPFSHQGDVTGGKPAHYTLHLESPTPLRVLLLPARPGHAPGATMRLTDAAGRDLGGDRPRAPRRDPRVLETTLLAGEYTVAIDPAPPAPPPPKPRRGAPPLKPSRAERPLGPYLLVAVACEAGDADCR